MTLAEVTDLSIKVASFVVSIAAMLVAVVRTRKTEVERRFEAGSELMRSHDRRLRDLEHAVQSVPTQNDLHELDRALARISAEIIANQERMVSVAASVQRIEDYLLKNSKG